MSENARQPEQDELIQEALGGNKAALADLFERNRSRLRKMVDLRLDRRIRQRVCPSDVLQEAYIDLAKQLPRYVENPKLPFFIWIRWLTGQRLAKIHRFHLDAEKRNAALEVSLYQGRMPQATSYALASKLIGSSTSIGGKLVEAEQLMKLQELLNTLDSDDREVLAMRHFEQLSNSEVALILDVSEPAAGMRYLRALRRLKRELKSLPELFAEDFAIDSLPEKDGEDDGN